MRRAKSRPMSILMGILAAANVVMVGFHFTKADYGQAAAQVVVGAICVVLAIFSWE